MAEDTRAAMRSRRKGKEKNANHLAPSGSNPKEEEEVEGNCCCPNGFTGFLKSLWMHRLRASITLILIGLCVFPAWVATTFIFETYPYRSFDFNFDDYIKINNSNYSVTCQAPRITDDRRLQAAMLMVYAVIFFVGTGGNFLVVYVIWHNPKMRTVTNMFITNLAISDLMVSTTSLWLTPLYIYTGYWIWGGWLCYGFPLFQGTSIFISTLTLMSIAVDRYFVIVHHSKTSANMNDHMTMPVCIASIIFIWTVSLSLVMPYAVHMRLAYIHYPCEYFICIEDWPAARLKSVYGFAVFSLQFIIPFMVIGVSYRNIWTFLNRRFRQLKEYKELAPSTNKAKKRNAKVKLETKRRRRLLRMLITMVLVFGFCWFPVNALNMFRDLIGIVPIRPYFEIAFLSAHMVSMMATAFNPILYAWMNESFREQFIKAVPKLQIILSKRSREDPRFKARIITDCSPASNRISCNDNVNGRLRLKISNASSNIVKTTDIPSLSPRMPAETIEMLSPTHRTHASPIQVCIEKPLSKMLSQSRLSLPHEPWQNGNTQKRSASALDVSGHPQECESLLVPEEAALNR